MRFVEIVRALLAQVDTYALDELAESTSVLVHLLTKVGRVLGVEGILRHYKWREVAMAGILKHRVFTRTSTGAGGDATDELDKLVEYKTGKIDSLKLNRSLRRNSIAVTMVYNGAYGEDRIGPYAAQRHFFGLFDEETEECLLIYEADTKIVLDQLRSNDLARSPGDSTNLNMVKLRIATSDPRIVYPSSLFERMTAALQS
jgi:hypothetical protein